MHLVGMGGLHGGGGTRWLGGRRPTRRREDSSRSRPCPCPLSALSCLVLTARASHAALPSSEYHHTSQHPRPVDLARRAPGSLCSSPPCTPSRLRLGLGVGQPPTRVRTGLALDYTHTVSAPDSRLARPAPPLCLLRLRALLPWVDRFAERGYSSILLDVDSTVADQQHTSSARLERLEQGGRASPRPLARSAPADLGSL